jgi:hypothetical protein
VLRNESQWLALLGLYCPHQPARGAVAGNHFRASPRASDPLAPQCRPFGAFPQKIGLNGFLRRPIPQLAFTF